MAAGKTYNVQAAIPKDTSVFNDNVVIRNKTGKYLNDAQVEAYNTPVFGAPGSTNVTAGYMSGAVGYGTGDAAGKDFSYVDPAANKDVKRIVDLTDPANKKPVQTTPAAPAWTLEGDPVYQAAMAAGQSKFNYARNAAMAEKNAAQLAAKGERQQLDVNATEGRRRLAGNYAARGMAGGAAGALTLAEAQANARQIAAQTSIKDKIAAVDMQYLQNYGADGTDWTGTLVGQQYKTEAAQAALTAQLAKLGVA